MVAPALTQARLKELVHYDLETGVFTARTARPHRPEGAVVGHPNRQGHILICVDGRKVSAHRLAWLYVTGEFPDGDLDHRNTDPGDNAWANLRRCTHRQNLQNCSLPSNNTSGFKGVFKRPGRPRWMARIRVDGRLKSLGDFDAPNAAARAYDAAAVAHFGEFARTNAMLGLL